MLIMMQVTFNIGNTGLSLCSNEELIVKIFIAFVAVRKL